MSLCTCVQNLNTRNKTKDITDKLPVSTNAHISIFVFVLGPHLGGYSGPELNNHFWCAKKTGSREWGVEYIYEMLGFEIGVKQDSYQLCYFSSPGTHNSRQEQYKSKV